MERPNEQDRQNNLGTFEAVKTVQVPDEILCKYCRNQLPPMYSEYYGKELSRHTNGHCLAYTDELKPHDVLWGESTECEYFDEP